MENASSLLARGMEGGRPIWSMPTLAEIRDYFPENFARLDDRYMRFEDPEVYSVTVEERLGKIQKQC